MERMIHTARLDLDSHLIDQTYHSLHNTTLTCSLALRLMPLQNQQQKLTSISLVSRLSSNFRLPPPITRCCLVHAPSALANSTTRIAYICYRCRGITHAASSELSSSLFSLCDYFSWQTSVRWWSFNRLIITVFLHSFLYI